jgi:hypothetical protein
MKRSTFSVVVMFLALGCSASENHSATYFANKGVTDKSDSMTTEGQDATTFGRRQSAKADKKSTSGESVPRKIIYTARVDLLVGDVAEASTKLSGMVQQFHGLVAQSEIKSDRGAPRAADWRVRVPVERFDDFIHQVVSLGEPTKNRTDSDDISDKFFDFQVRIANKKVQVERLQKIIKEQTGKVSELLEAERELGRVTTELEELEGTLKLWENQTSLATVNITLLERSRYIPPESPTFAASVSRTFKGSVDSLVGFLQNVALGFVAFAPWAPVAALFAVPCWFLLRRTKVRAH